MPEQLSVGISLLKWDLVTPQDLWAALFDLSSEGYRGTVSTFPDQFGVNVWQIEMSINDAPEEPPVIANQGEILVRIGNAKVEKFTQDGYVQRYGG
jgi:hypothetical protein